MPLKSQGNLMVFLLKNGQISLMKHSILPLRTTVSTVNCARKAFSCMNLTRSRFSTSISTRSDDVKVPQQLNTSSVKERIPVLVSPEWLKDNLSKVILLDTCDYEVKESQDVVHPDDIPTVKQDLMKLFNFFTGKNTATTDDEPLKQAVTGAKKDQTYIPVSSFQLQPSSIIISLSCY